MKRLIIVFLAVICLGGCAKQSAGFAPNEYQLYDYNSSHNIFADGLFYDGGSGRLCFLDYDSMYGVPVCPNPNCPHEDPDVCSSFGMTRLPAVIDGRIYYFEDNTHYGKNNELIEEVIAYSADINGTGRIKEGVIGNQSLLEMGNAILVDKTIYFSAMSEEDNGKSSLRIRKYNYTEKIDGDFSVIQEGYNLNVKFCGAQDGKIYFMLFYLTQPDIYDEDRSLDWDRHMENSRTEYYSLDIATGSYSQWEIPEKIKNANGMDVYTTVKDGCFVYSDSKDTLVVNSEGEEFFFDGYDACNISIHNGILFPYLNSGENMGIDLEKGELIALTLNDENISWAYVCALHDGRYILRYIDLEANQQLYKKADLKIG